jgi:hypothetical protein
MVGNYNYDFLYLIWNQKFLTCYFVFSIFLLASFHWIPTHHRGATTFKLEKKAKNYVAFVTLWVKELNICKDDTCCYHMAHPFKICEPNYSILSARFAILANFRLKVLLDLNIGTRMELSFSFFSFLLHFLHALTNHHHNDSNSKWKGFYKLYKQHS